MNFLLSALLGIFDTFLRLMNFQDREIVFIVCVMSGFFC